MIPKDTVSAARAALQMLYNDRADVYRATLSDNVIETQKIYTALPCHLSLDSKPVLQQGGQVATAPAEFTAYFPPDTDICEGDRLKITHSGSVDEYDVGTVHSYHINRICRCKRRGIV
mgnify:CR=1 FL=1